jgi:hypothetical protein
MMVLLMSKNTVNITLPVGACDLNFFIQSTVRCLHCMPAGFPFGSKWQNHISLSITIHHRKASPSLCYHCKCSSSIDIQCCLCMSQ